MNPTKTSQDNHAIEPSGDAHSHQLVLTVVQPKCSYPCAMPIRKAYSFVPDDASLWLNAVGKTGQYEKAGPKAPPKYFRSHEVVVNEFADLPKWLRFMHTQPERALVLGRVIEEHRAKENQLQNFQRIRKNFDDVPSSLFMVDIDGFDMAMIDEDFDMRIAAVEFDEFERGIEKMVASYFPAPFHDCSLVAEMTSSAPLKAQGKPSLLYGRLWFQMAVPLKICQMKVLAEQINEQSSVKDFLDCSIYAPEHLLYTANAEITAPVISRDGGPIKHEPVAYPFERAVRFIELSVDEVTLPEQPVEIPVKVTAKNGHTLAEVANRYAVSESASEAELWGSMRPGSTHTTLVRLIGKYATRTPNHRTEGEKKKLKEALAAKLAETSVDENHFQSRCDEHLSKVDKEWHKTVTEHKYRNYQPTEKRADKKRDGLADARVKLKLYMEEQERHAAAYNPIQKLGKIDMLGSKGEVSVKVFAQHSVYQVALGVGKSTTRMKLIEPRQLFDMRTDWFTPTHKLAKQAASDMKEFFAHKLGMTDDEIAQLVRVHYGRQKKGMCINQEFDKLARVVEASGGSPWKSVCKVACPDCGKCPYSVQREDVGAGVVIRAHAALHSAYRGLKPFVTDEDGNEQRNPRLPDRVVVDESVLGVSLSSESDSSRYSRSMRPVSDLMVTDSNETPLIQREGIAGVDDEGAVWGSVRDEERGGQLQQLRAQLANLLTHAGTPHLMAGAVAFNPKQIEQAFELEVAHRLMVGGMLRQVQKQGQEPDNKSAAKMFEQRTSELQELFTTSLFATKIWQLITMVREAPERQRVAGVRLKDIAGKRYVEAMQAKKIPKILSYISTEWLDGTGNEKLTRALLSNLQNLVFRTVDAESQNYTFTQYADKSFATGALVSEKLKGPWARTEREELRHLEKLEKGIELSPTPERKRRTDSAMDRLRRFIIHKASQHKDVAVIAAKRVREELEQGLPANVFCLHFGALRGQNELKDVGALIVVGRSAPHYEALELMTEGLFWNNAALGDLALADAWPRGSVEIEMANGLIIDIPGERHGDELVELMRRQIVDAEVEQAVGRARLVMRDGENPCSVYYFGQASTGIPAHSLRNFVDADFNLAEIALDAGVVFKKAESLAKAWPMLMPKAVARRKEVAKQVWGGIESSSLNGSLPPIIENTYIRDKELITQPLHLCEFRLAASKPKTGKKQFKQQALIDAARHSDPVAIITRLLGEEIEWLGWNGEGPKAQIPSTKINNGEYQLLTAIH